MAISFAADGYRLDAESAGPVSHDDLMVLLRELDEVQEALIDIRRSKQFPSFESLVCLSGRIAEPRCSNIVFISDAGVGHGWVRMLGAIFFNDQVHIFHDEDSAAAYLNSSAVDLGV